MISVHRLSQIYIHARTDLQSAQLCWPCLGPVLLGQVGQTDISLNAPPLWRGHNKASNFHQNMLISISTVWQHTYRPV